MCHSSTWQLTCVLRVEFQSKYGLVSRVMRYTVTVELRLHELSYQQNASVCMSCSSGRGSYHNCFFARYVPTCRAKLDKGNTKHDDVTLTQWWDWWSQLQLASSVSPLWLEHFPHYWPLVDEHEIQDTGAHSSQRTGNVEGVVFFDVNQNKLFNIKPKVPCCDTDLTKGGFRGGRTGRAPPLKFFV